MTLYQEQLLAIARAYIYDDYTGIISEMHIALNYVLNGLITHDEYYRLVKRARAYIIHIDKKGGYLMSRPKTTRRKLSRKTNGHGTVVYHVNIPDVFLPIFEYGNLEIEIEPNKHGGLTLTPVRKEV